MADNIQVRLVNVEFLRPGPPQNQLLSPLTQYLAVCGDAGAGVVTVPYEHATFERKLKELRYETGDPGDRLAMLHDIGVDMGRILGSVPGLPGSLTVDPGQAGLLVHLRLTLSATELALLPFEIAKGPLGPNATAESWLAIQTRPPVCLTRNIRTVSPEGVVWPHVPRVLFVAGDPDNIPFKEHRDALIGAIQPFRYPGRDDASRSSDGTREQFGELLTILVNPTLTEVFRECRETRYTHVHILAHGDLDESTHDSYGLVLRGPDESADVISGERFCNALTAVGSGHIHRPSVVTVASCDSGNVGTVVRPGASFAHALHQGGVPLVVASQFPLSTEGSVPLVATLYTGLLWGGNPLPLLQEIRAELHARYTSRWHDWASLVVYEALPQALGEQLDRVQYFQGRRALDAALERIDRAVRGVDASLPPDSFDEHASAIAHAVERLPLAGPYAVECVGLRGSAHKRLAQAAFVLAAQASPDLIERNMDAGDLLAEAWRDYDRAVRGLLVSDGRALQRIATLHWVLVQAESLSAVLGRARDAGRWEAAKLSAEMHCEHPDDLQRAWAQGSLAELWLIRLADADIDDDEERRAEFADLAFGHALDLARFCPSRAEAPLTSTWRQLARYVDWWGTPRFEQDLAARGVERNASWGGRFGVIETATRLMAALQPGPSGRSDAPAAPAASSPPVAAAPAATTSGAPALARASAALATSHKPQGVPPKRVAPFFDIEMLPAQNGDSLWIEYGDASATHRWLVDCGTAPTAAELRRRVELLKKKDRQFELLVLSHIDADHIGGVLTFLNEVKKGMRFGDVWFNGWRHLSGQLGSKQGEMFSSALQDLNLPWNRWRQGQAIVVEGGDLPEHTLPGGMKLTLLSPGREQLAKLAPAWARELKKAGLVPGAHVDYSSFLRGTPSTSTNVDKLADTPFAGDAAAPNGSSIALLAEFGGASALLGADAHAPVVVESVRKLLRQRGIDRLRLDVFKVSHHASQNNVSTELLQLLDCKSYGVSTNGDHFCHPDREAIARIIKYGGKGPVLHFNYRTRYNDVWERPDLQKRYGYTATYRKDDQPSASLALLPAGGGA